MKKYLYIYKNSLLSDLQYIINLFIGFLSYIILIFIFLNLWQYIYGDSNQIINGYTIDQMIWYVCLTEILWMTLSGRKLCTKISEDIKLGNVVYNINKPYNYINYILFNHLGEITVKGFIYSLLGILLGFIFIGKFPLSNIMSCFIVIISCVLATIISSLLIIFIGLISFFIEDSTPLYWVYSKIILVLGTIFPIEYFPGVIKTILCYSPIYVVTYGPAKIFVNFSLENSMKILTVQIIYILISYLLCMIIYKKVVKKLNVNGG